MDSVAHAVTQMAVTSVEWTQVLSFANTLLLGLVSFLVRDAWISIHKRIDSLEKEDGFMRERITALEVLQGFKPRRRRTDIQQEG